METVTWLLRECRANIAELADALKGFYLPEKGWPPHIGKAAEMVAEIDDFLDQPEPDFPKKLKEAYLLRTDAETREAAVRDAMEDLRELLTCAEAKLAARCWICGTETGEHGGDCCK